MKIIIFPLILIFLGFSACTTQAQIGKLKDKVSGILTEGEGDVGSALKEALENGVNKGTDFLAKKDGYLGSPYKILLPEEAQPIVSRLKNVPGFNNVETDLTERINRAAEEAVVRAKPIFKQAIVSMTVRDATGILMGEENAATLYLNKTTYTSLYNEFQPIIMEALNKVNAIELWEASINTYNKIPLVTKANPRLDDHVTHKALEGLFNLIAKEEKEIRNNVNARNSELLKKVFARQDKK